MRIVAYTYEADIHCWDCATAAGMAKADARDREGNSPHPVFDIDEGWKGEVCGTCFCRIE